MLEFLDYRTRDVMTTEAITVGPDDSLATIEEIFEKHPFNGCPVVAPNGGVVGVVTKLDVLRAFDFDDEHMFPPYEEIMKVPVSSIMNRDLQSVCPNTPLTRVLHKMIRTRSKSFPVLDGDRLVGIVAREDVILALRRAAGGLRPEVAEESA